MNSRFLTVLSLATAIALLAGCDPTDKAFDTEKIAAQQQADVELAAIRCNPPSWVPDWYINSLHEQVSVTTVGNAYKGSHSLVSDWLPAFGGASALMAMIAGFIVRFGTKGKLFERVGAGMAACLYAFLFMVVQWLVIWAFASIIRSFGNGTTPSVWGGWSFCLSTMSIPVEAIALAALLKIEANTTAAENTRKLEQEAKAEAEKQTLRLKLEEKRKIEAERRERKLAKGT
jgi:hypothetical protein